MDEKRENRLSASNQKEAEQTGKKQYSCGAPLYIWFLPVTVLIVLVTICLLTRELPPETPKIPAPAKAPEAKPAEEKLPVEEEVSRRIDKLEKELIKKENPSAPKSEVEKLLDEADRILELSEPTKDRFSEGKKQEELKIRIQGMGKADTLEQEHQLQEIKACTIELTMLYKELRKKEEDYRKKSEELGSKVWEYVRKYEKTIPQQEKGLEEKKTSP